MIFSGVDETQAAYWNGPLSRKEAQKTFDDYAKIIKQLLADVHGNAEANPPQEGLIGLIAKLDMTLAFLADKMGVTPQEFQAYMNKKVAEFRALQIAAKEAKQ
jgi:hypothetical protein